MYIVYCSDMEAIYRKLEKNEYGFRVQVGKRPDELNDQNELGQNSLDTVPSDTTEEAQDDKTNTTNVNSINVQKRRIITSSELYPRPSILIEREPHGELSEALLNLHRLLLNDSFALDYHHLNLLTDDEKYHYYGGRAYRLYVSIKQF